MRSAEATLIMNNPALTRAFGERLGRLLKAGDVVALFGDLGAGKTTLTQGIAAGLEIDDEVDSPTYLLVQEHRGRLTLFHADLYRIEDSSSLTEMGFEEYFEREGVTVIEWAERATDILPEERLEIHLRYTPEAEDTREITLKGWGTRFSQLLESVKVEAHRAEAQ